MSSRSRELIFRLCAAGPVVAGAFHLAAMVNPAIARVEYDPTYSVRALFRLFESVADTKKDDLLRAE